MFGYIACRTTSKITGCGSAERAWADDKELKSGKRSHLSSDKLMKQASLYTSSNLRQARIKREALERADCQAKEARWGDEDEQIDLGLDKWDVDIENLKKSIDVPRCLFKAWVEEWEDVKENGAVMRTKLLEKYGGLVFDDIDVTPAVRMRVSSTKLKWIKQQGWHALAELPDYTENGDDDLLEPIQISDEVLIELIKNTEQPGWLNVRMVNEGEIVLEDTNSDNDTDNS